MSKPLHQPTEKTRAEIIALRSYGVPIKEVAAYKRLQHSYPNRTWRMRVVSVEKRY